MILRKNPRFTDVDLAVCSRMLVYATREHDGLCVNCLANQVTILARYCLFSSLAVILSSWSLFIKQFFQQFFSYDKVFSALSKTLSGGRAHG